jgi:hypothetical protein
MTWLRLIFISIHLAVPVLILLTMVVNMRREIWQERVHIALIDLLASSPALVYQLFHNMDRLVDYAVKDVKSTGIPILHRGTVYH